MTTRRLLESSLLFGIAALLAACGSDGGSSSGPDGGNDDPKPSKTACVGGTLTDSRDGKVYACDTVGTRIWMTQNLDFGKKSVPGAVDQGDASVSAAEKYCYGDDDANCLSDGALYSWHSALALAASCTPASCAPKAGARGLCPEGWHVPTSAEFAELESFYDTANDSTPNHNAVPQLVSDEFWKGIMAGARYAPTSPDDSLPFTARGSSGIWWTADGGQWELSNTFEAASYPVEGYAFSLRCASDAEVVVPDEGSSSSSGLSSAETSSSSSEAISYAVVDPIDAATCEAAGLCGSFTDSRDGHVYRWTKIGERTWMAQNLDYGAMVANAPDGTDGNVAVTLADGQKFCYDNDASNCSDYGALYQWHVAMGKPASCGSASCADSGAVRGVCPEGWHMPGIEDWNRLLGNVNYAAPKLQSSSWSGGTDDYLWAALAAGRYRYSETAWPSYFAGKGSFAFWWLADETTETNAATGSIVGYVDQGFSNKLEDALSVRCVKD